MSHQYTNELERVISINAELLEALKELLERNKPIMSAVFLVENGAAQSEIDNKRKQDALLIDKCDAAIAKAGAP